MRRPNSAPFALALALIGFCLLALAGIAAPMAIHRALENQAGDRPRQPLLSLP